MDTKLNGHSAAFHHDEALVYEKRATADIADPADRTVAAQLATMHATLAVAATQHAWYVETLVRNDG